jgi:hypothetical protein
MKSLWNKIIFVVLLYLTVMLLAACGGGSSGLSGDTSGGSETITASSGLSDETGDTGSSDGSASQTGGSSSSNETGEETGGSGSSSGSTGGTESPDPPGDASGKESGNTGSADGNDGSTGQTGILRLSLTDASADYQAVYVTVARVDVKMKSEEEPDGEPDGEVDGEPETEADAEAAEGSGWITVVEPMQTYDLLELMNGVLAPLGAGELAVGQYGQLRLILGEEADETLNILGEAHPHANYLIDSEGDSHELKVPSGLNTGIKIINGFSITAAQATELTLDFDAGRSVVQAGKKGKYMLKPVIKVLETVESSADGGITDNEDNPVEGVVVSAQIHDPDAGDPKDAVIVESTTLSTAEGSFTLLLPPGTYNIVAVTAGYLPTCQEGVSEFGEEFSSAISLTPAPDNISLSGSVAGLDAVEDSALLSIRLEIDCGSGPVTVEVANVSVANDSDFGDIVLPFDPGLSYDVVVSAEGKVTQVITDIIVDTVLDIVMENNPL